LRIWPNNFDKIGCNSFSDDVPGRTFYHFWFDNFDATKSRIGIYLKCFNFNLRIFTLKRLHYWLWVAFSGGSQTDISFISPIIISSNYKHNEETSAKTWNAISSNRLLHPNMRNLVIFQFDYSFLKLSSLQKLYKGLQYLMIQKIWCKFKFETMHLTKSWSCFDYSNNS